MRHYLWMAQWVDIIDQAVKVIDTVKWPGLIGLIVWGFRKPVANRIENIENFEAGATGIKGSVRSREKIAEALKPGREAASELLRDAVDQSADAQRALIAAVSKDAPKEGTAVSEPGRTTVGRGLNTSWNVEAAKMAADSISKTRDQIESIMESSFRAGSLAAASSARRSRSGKAGALQPRITWDGSEPRIGSYLDEPNGEDGPERRKVVIFRRPKKLTRDERIDQLRDEIADRYIEWSDAVAAGNFEVADLARRESEELAAERSKLLAIEGGDSPAVSDSPT